jgi:hypothetical protein
MKYHPWVVQVQPKYKVKRYKVPMLWVRSGTAKYNVKRYKVPMLWVRSGTDKHKLQSYEVSYQCYGFVQEHKYKVQRYEVPMLWVRSGTAKNIRYSGTENQRYGFVQVQLNIRYKGKVFYSLVARHSQVRYLLSS